MAQLRWTVLLIASAFLVLQLTELVAAATTMASWYQGPFYPSACFGDDPSQDKFIAAGGGSSSADIWNNSLNCGKSFQIQCLGNGCKGIGRSISVKLVDFCVTCSGETAFDLSNFAFDFLADLNVGLITVEYSLLE